MIWDSLGMVLWSESDFGNATLILGSHLDSILILASSLDVTLQWHALWGDLFWYDFGMVLWSGSHFGNFTLILGSRWDSTLILVCRLHVTLLVASLWARTLVWAPLWNGPLMRVSCVGRHFGSGMGFCFWDGTLIWVPLCNDTLIRVSCLGWHFEIPF